MTAVADRPWYRHGPCAAGLQASSPRRPSPAAPPPHLTPAIERMCEGLACDQRKIGATGRAQEQNRHTPLKRMQRALYSHSAITRALWSCDETHPPPLANSSTEKSYPQVAGQKVALQRPAARSKPSMNKSLSIDLEAAPCIASSAANTPVIRYLPRDPLCYLPQNISFLPSR